jgi:hypothetical protein
MRLDQLAKAMRRSFRIHNLTALDEQIAAWAIPSGEVSVAELTSKLRDLADDLRDLADDLEKRAPE